MDDLININGLYTNTTNLFRIRRDGIRFPTHGTLNRGVRRLGGENSYLNDEIIRENEEERYDALSEKKYGSLAMSTLKKLVSNKLMNWILTERLNFRIVSLYYSNIDSEKKTQTFIKCLPSLKYINKIISELFPLTSANEEIINEINVKNVIFIKLCLDIYESYYKNYDFPLFTKYKKVFLKIALKFYTRLPNVYFTYINTNGKNNKINTLGMKTAEFNSKDEYIEYYLNENKIYCLLSIECNLNDFIK